MRSIAMDSVSDGEMKRADYNRASLQKSGGNMNDPRSVAARKWFQTPSYYQTIKENNNG